MLHIPTIAIFHSNIRKLSELFDNYEFPESYTGRILYSNNPDAIGPLIAREQPSVIITCADSTQYDDTINTLNYQVNLIWHQEENLETVYTNLLHYAELATSHDCLVSRNPRFSICTPTHNTPRHAILRLYNSLKMQTYRDWEWVIYDTSTNYETIGELLNIASNDPRVKITFNRFEPRTGNIGFVKNQVFMLATGDYLIEVDHDDALVPNCLNYLSQGIQTFSVSEGYEPDFVSSDTFEYDEATDKPIFYGWTFAFDLGQYREAENWMDNPMMLTHYNDSPITCPKSLTMIVGIPNHLRCWKRTFYHSIGGHNKMLAIGDDYELFIRTVINTKDILKIDAPLYIQYMHGDNSQEDNRGYITELCRRVYNTYKEKINQRFELLENPCENMSYEEIVENWWKFPNGTSITKKFDPHTGKFGY